MTVATKTKRALSRIPRGVWRNVYYNGGVSRCAACGEIYMPGETVVGCVAFPSRELAEETFLRRVKLKPPSRYLGAKFFPEK